MISQKTSAANMTLLLRSRQVAYLFFFCTLILTTVSVSVYWEYSMALIEIDRLKFLMDLQEYQIRDLQILNASLQPFDDGQISKQSVDGDLPIRVTDLICEQFPDLIRKQFPR